MAIWRCSHSMPAAISAPRWRTGSAVELDAHEEREFEDGEHKARPLVSVRDRDVYVLQSLHSDAQQSVNDKLVRLLLFLGALKDASAARVTAVVPYLAYARKDRKSKPRDPVSTRYVAQLFEAVGVDCIVTLDVHNLAAFQNAFRCRCENLEANPLFVAHFAGRLADADVVVVAPDAGGIKRAEDFRRRLAAALGRPVPMAFAEKHRSSGIVSGEALVGDVSGRVAIIVDDLISGGTTAARAAQACRARGAQACARRGIARPVRGRCRRDACAGCHRRDRRHRHRIRGACPRRRVAAQDHLGQRSAAVRRGDRKASSRGIAGRARRGLICRCCAGLPGVAAAGVPLRAALDVR